MSMRRWSWMLAGAMPVLGMSTLTANAGTGLTQVLHPHTYKTEVRLGKETLAAPEAFVLYNTTYMPIWYVMNSLNKLGIKSEWNGRSWKLTTPKNIPVNLKAVTPGKGNAHIYLNGHLIWSLKSAVATDPSSGKPSTYMPIWYVMQALKRVGIESTWGKSLWVMSTPNWSKPVSSGGGSKTGSASGTGTSSGGGTKTGSGAPSTGAGNGSGSGASGQSGSSGSGPTPGPQPPVVVPQPPLPANEVPRWSFDQQLLTALNIAPDNTGVSPYDDIAATNPNWGYVHSAIEHGLVPADSATHSGAYEAITLQMADTAYWNALGISSSDGSYQPGANPVAWAGMIGLNPPGLSGTSDLSPQDIDTFFANLNNLMQGYRTMGNNTYQVVYPPADEASATFAGDSLNGQLFFPNSSAVQQAIQEVYQFYDKITVQEQAGNLILTMPNLIGTDWFAYASTTNDIQYSLDGGMTWQSTSALDTRNLAGDSQAAYATQILLKAPDENGISLSISQLLPSFRGSVVLGELQISTQNGQLLVNRINVAG